MIIFIIIEVDINLNNFIGNLLKDLGRTEEALFDYSKAVEINPLNSKAYKNRGR